MLLWYGPEMRMRGGTTPVQRDTARVILVSPAGQVLLFQHHLPDPWAQRGWLTPGGAIGPGETPAQAAVRELEEETGHTITQADIGGAVAVDSGQWQAGPTAFATVNWYFFARTATSHVDLSGQDDGERSALLDHRWWTIADLHATRDLILPIGLAGLLPRLLHGHLQHEPIRLPWT
jgi:8-oxo-dGTP pyrophosphatase MutT (NUDIX family)